MKKLKKLATPNNINIVACSPFAESDKEYPILSDDDFRKKYRKLVFTPSILKINGDIYEIQFNYWCNTFCKWYGMPQKKYDEIKSKPSRYKLGGAEQNQTVPIVCNNIPQGNSFGGVLGNKTDTISNWSVAEEIRRLITINIVIPITKEYEFHKEGCANTTTSPFDNPELFYKRGKSSSNSTRYQCKECKKMTNVLPQQHQCHSYQQKRNDILVQFTKDILSKTPVKRTCEKLGIGSATYYNKLEWLYRKCLEFLQRHETDVFKDKTFHDIWLDTDAFIYNLNNI